MKKLCLAIMILFCAVSLNAQTVVINEIYGGGGNTGSTYKNDFIELYNNSSSSVSLAGWSVQYTSAAGTSWTVTNLSGSIAANGYYLIQQAAGTGGTTNLPTPDAIGTIAMSGSAGKVILVDVTTAQTGTCPTGAQIIDKVGYGSTANCFEGTGPTTAPSNTNSVQRTPIGTDTDQNATDFTAGAPSPVSGGAVADVTPPAITALSPTNNQTNVATSFTASVTFDETVTKGTSGTISIKKMSDNLTVQAIDILNASVTVSGANVSFMVSSLAFNTGYYVEITAAAFKDLAGNNFAGITGSAIWSFTTSATPPSGVIGTTYNFNTCTAGISDGFSQYSATGSQFWACTTFGRDPANPAGTTAFPNAVQINGYDNTIPGNVLNEDWLISPSFDLTGTTYPLLSFWSRTAFNGAPLQLKVSTNYPGTGDPRNFTWTDLNGKFPAQTSNIWTLSDQLNLSAYKSANTFFAFVYNSSADDGARWTVDDVTLINSATPPAPSLTTNTNDIEFGFVANGTSGVKTFILTGNDLTGDISLTSTGNYLISKTNGSFTNNITYTQIEADNIPQTVHVQFTPTAASTTYAGTVTVSTPGVTNVVISLDGNSIDPATTLEVVNWNIEWFGSTTLGPSNDNLQETNVKTIVRSIGADLYGFVEVVDEARLQSVVADLNSVYGAGAYAYVISNYGSHTNPFSSSASPLSEAQKQAFVYKTSVVSPIGTPGPLLANGVNTATDLTNPAYNYFSSGRYPYMMNATVTLGGVSKDVRFILIHAKANTSPTTTSYNRRKAGSDTLHYTLNNLYPNDNIVFLGDFNDDLDQSITAGFTTTSYSAFTNDNANFYSPTLSLSLAGKKSTVSYNDVIDHVVVSNEMQAYYMGSTASILTDVSSLVSNYGSTTSDHYPVFTRYSFTAVVPVTLVSFNAIKQHKNVLISWTTSQEINTKEFVVERSINGRSWAPIATVNAAGNSNAVRTYSYTDLLPVKGMNFYRIRIVDTDNKFTQSHTKTVLFASSDVVLITPNPASSYINIFLGKNNNSLTRILMTDANGKVVANHNTNEQVYQLNTSSMAKGLYILKIVGENTTTTQKVIIQ